MDRRPRRKSTMSILPSIHETEGANKSRSKRWMWLALAACSGVVYTKVGPQHRRLSSMARPTLRFIPKHTLLFDDGTLFAPQGEEPICDYLTSSKRRHTQVKRLHLHLQSCQDSPSQFEEYFEALLLANSAQILFTMTCGGALQDSLMSRLVTDNDSIGHVPMDATGRSWTPADLCRDEGSHLYLVKDAIQNALQEIVPKTTIDDMVIQFDPSVSVSTYTEIISEAQFEGGPVESIAIVGTGPHLLVQHLERSFPDIAIQTIDEEEDMLHLYSRLMYARVAGVCSTPSLCGYAMLSGAGGFLNQEGSPEWILVAAKSELSKVEVFKATSTRVS